jgi:hypothetical protein
MLLTNCAFCKKLKEQSTSVNFRTFFEAFFEKNAEMVFAIIVANIVSQADIVITVRGTSVIDSGSKSAN